MKLSFIELAGFRGFRDWARFEFPAGFVVLTGRNGAGKSTVLDAVDYVLTGTINKYAVTSAKGGGLDEHIWWVGEGVSEKHYVTLGIVDDSGEEIQITRSRERGLELPLEEIRRRLCIGSSEDKSWAHILMRTTLIRDETIATLSLDLPEQARAAAVRDAMGTLGGPDHSKRASALLQAALLAKENQEIHVKESQAELGRALSALTEARSLAERQTDVAEAERIIETLASDLAALPSERAELLRRRVADRKQSIADLDAALAQLDRLEQERLQLESAAGIAQFEALRQQSSILRQSVEQSESRFAQAKQIEALERENDAFVSTMSVLLEHGEAIGLQSGHCPLCQAAQKSEDFTAAIAAGRNKLSIKGARAAAAFKAVEQERLALSQVQTALTEVTVSLEAWELKRANLLVNLQKVSAIFTRWNFASVTSDPESARKLLLERREETVRLEHALFVLEASAAHDRVTALEGRIEKLRLQLDNEIAKQTAVERGVEVARQIEHAAKTVINQVLIEQFDTVLPLLKELYQRLRPHADWREIETDFGGRVRASLNFTVGGHNPQFLFSSGQRRAAGIAFLLAIHLSRPWCRLRSLLLDDPVQHIDDYRALNLLEVLSAVRRTGRQVIVAVEDPALADVLCRRLRSTVLETGRRFELGTAKNGSAIIERQVNIFPLPREILRTAEVS